MLTAMKNALMAALGRLRGKKSTYPNTPSQYIAIDPRVIDELDPLLRSDARETLRWAAARTDSHLGPGKWLQIIKRDSAGRFKEHQNKIKEEGLF